MIGVGIALVQVAIRRRISGNGAAFDTVPSAFVFDDVGSAARNTLYTSNAIEVADIDSTIGWSWTSATAGWEYRKNAGAWTPISSGGGGTVDDGDTLEFRNTSSALYSTSISGTLSLNGVVDTWTITTIADPGSGFVPSYYWLGF